MIKKEEKQELEEFLFTGEKKPKEKAVKIIYDGRQYSIRIPKEFAETLKIDPVKDKALFKMIIPQTKEKGEPQLIIEYVRG